MTKCAATVEFRRDGTVATSFDGRESVSEFTFRAHAWPRACTIEVCTIYMYTHACMLHAAWYIVWRVGDTFCGWSQTPQVSCVSYDLDIVACFTHVFLSRQQTEKTGSTSRVQSCVWCGDFDAEYFNFRTQAVHTLTFVLSLNMSGRPADK